LDGKFNIDVYQKTRVCLQMKNLYSSCCGNSICHFRESGNPVFRSGPLLSQGWHRRFSFSATDTIYLLQAPILHRTRQDLFKVWLTRVSFCGVRGILSY